MTDDDHTRFTRWEGLKDKDGNDAILSTAAFQLHSFGIMNSFELGHPGFISDDYLNAITAESSITAAELESLGLWERVDDGYLVHDDSTMDMFRRAFDHVERMNDEDEES